MTVFGQLHILFLEKLLITILSGLVVGGSAFAEEGFFSQDYLPRLLQERAPSVGFLIGKQNSDQYFGLGTATWICSNDGKSSRLLTANHTISAQRCEDSCVLAWDEGGEQKLALNFQLQGDLATASERSYRIVNQDLSLDLALLEPTEFFKAPHCLESSAFKGGKVEDEVVILGFPYLVHRPSPQTFSDLIRKRGSIGRVTPLRHNRFPHSLITDADALPGNSGSPVFASSGDVLGLVHLIYMPDTIPNAGPQGFEIIPYGGITLFVPGQRIRAFLQSIE
jgi:hypothetical protein